MKSLSPAQKAMLTSLAKHGRSLTPGGYKDAGRDASRWYRTVACLERRGLVRSWANVAEITDAGRKVVQALTTSKQLDAARAEGGAS